MQVHFEIHRRRELGWRIMLIYAICLLGITAMLRVIIDLYLFLIKLRTNSMTEHRFRMLSYTANALYYDGNFSVTVDYDLTIIAAVAVLPLEWQPAALPLFCRLP